MTDSNEPQGRMEAGVREGDSEPQYIQYVVCAVCGKHVNLLAYYITTKIDDKHYCSGACLDNATLPKGKQP